MGCYCPKRTVCYCELALSFWEQALKHRWNWSQKPGSCNGRRAGYISTNVEGCIAKLQSGSMKTGLHPSLCLPPYPTPKALEAGILEVSCGNGELRRGQTAHRLSILASKCKVSIVDESTDLKTEIGLELLSSCARALALSLPSQLSPRTIRALSPHTSSGSRCTVLWIADCCFYVDVSCELLFLPLPSPGSHYASGGLRSAPAPAGRNVSNIVRCQGIM